MATLDVIFVGNVAHDAVDASNPIKIGGKARSSIPSQVATLDRTDAWFDTWGRMVVSDQDVELGQTIGSTSLRDRTVAQRYTRLSDSVADGLAAFWTQTTANGGTITVATGEGVIATSSNNNSLAQMTSSNLKYYPGQEAWLNSAIRFGDTGIANNIRRVGACTVDGSGNPLDGFFFELSGTTLNAVIMKAGSVISRIASAAWSRATDAPFTLDANYHQFELRYTSNRVRFYIDNVLRHSVTDATQPITATLDFPIFLQSINTGGGTGGKAIYVRNIGMGCFGEPPPEFLYESHAADQNGANAVLTFNVIPGQLVMVDVDPVIPTDTNNYRARATCDGSTPSATNGFVCRPGTSYLPVPTSGVVKVWAPASTVVAVQVASK